MATQRKQHMANIDLTQWHDDLPVQVVVDHHNEIVDIIIGNDDLFIRQNHAAKLLKALAAQLEGSEQ